MSQSAQPETQLPELIGRLRAAGLDWDAETIADWLWLSRYVDSAPLQTKTSGATETDRKQPAPEIANPDPAPLPAPPAPAASLSAPASGTSQRRQSESNRAKGIPFQTPTPPALRQTLALGRSLRPLMRKVDSYTRTVLDEAATAELTAEQQFCITVERPAKERWLELALVVELSQTSPLWEDTIRDFKRLLERQGAFRTITVWYLKPSTANQIDLFAKSPNRGSQQAPRSPRELIDPSGRRLILVISDCISAVWRQEALHQDYLALWANHGPLALVQLLPGHLWQRTVLRAGLESRLCSWNPGAANHKLFFQEEPLEASSSLDSGLKLPVITMEPAALSAWAKMLGGGGHRSAVGVWFDEGWRQHLELPRPQRESPGQGELDPRQQAKQRVDRFFNTASDLAWELAQLMAMAPVSLPIIYLLQETMLPESQPLHLAEVFMSGLVQQVEVKGVESQPHESKTPTQAVYEFLPLVRDELLESANAPNAEQALQLVSQYIGRRIGRNIYSFMALLQLEKELGDEAGVEVINFAQVTRQVLRSLGGDYGELVDAVDHVGGTTTQPLPNLLLDDFPPLEEFDFIDAQLVDEDAPPPPFSPPLQTDRFTVITFEAEPETDSPLESFEFTIATLAKQQDQWQVQEQPGRASRFVELLTGELFEETQEVVIEMVAIPGGSFTMGSPESEVGRFDRESPQHEVTLEPFFLGRYPVTQAQWRVVAGLPQVERKLDPDPSRFKGDRRRPVERVSWYDAVEFCARLSAHTGRPYRLPSEAEWEYACRAGTTTAFSFGDMITTEVANYDGSVYGDGPAGENRGETTPVNQFELANPWGLSDMHGNVREWCQDHWHGNYEKAPEDGSAWLTDNEWARRILRGGSWALNPWGCRSACRNSYPPDYRTDHIGFRLCCAAPRA